MALLERILHPNGVVIYRSSGLHALGVPHAFSTRIGGVSTGVFHSLNLGNPGGVDVKDDAQNIAENYRRLHHAIGCEHRRRVFVHQVHGCTVVDADESIPTDTIYDGTELGQADALTTTDAALLLSVRTADCVPVLIASTDGSRVAAVHAGWRGVVGGAVTQALKYFLAGEVCVAVGPHISVRHFEVGDEVAQQFGPKLARGFAPEFARESAQEFASEFTAESASDSASNCVTHHPVYARPHVDLQKAIVKQLTIAGVREDRIDTTDRCTVAHADMFFSHRREHGITGRMAAVIGVRA